MSGRLYDLADKLAHARGLRSLVRGVKRRVPDATIVRTAPHVDGKLAFGLRRHHWLLGPNCFSGHGRTLGLFRHLVRDGDAFYDVGGNIGYYARWTLANLPISRLVAFEPMADNLKLLRKNRQLCRRRADFEIVATALSDRDGDAELQVDDQSDGSAALSRVTGGAASESRVARGLPPLTETVREVRLDAWREERGDLPPPSVMKIDTEGAEHLVLAGATATLAAHRPRLILAMHGVERGRLAFETLAASGYRAAGWVRAGDAMAWHRVTADDADRLADNNCIASTDDADLSEPPVLEL